MKREILFRAKTVYAEPEWVEGYYAKAYNTIEDIPTVPIIEDKNGGWDEIDPETLGQFTGLRDRKGVRIYEGDIVVNTSIDSLSNRPHVVEFHPNAGYVYIEPRKKSLVIGNIYDNPELIDDRSLKDVISQEEYHISTRVFNCIYRWARAHDIDILTVEQFLEIDPFAWKRVRNCGKKTAQEIINLQEKLKGEDYRAKMDRKESE